MRPPRLNEDGGVLFITLDDPDALNDGQAVGVRQPLYQTITDRQEPRVAIDLDGIDFLSSSGVAFLIGLKRRVDAQHGRMVLFHIHPHVLELFRVMRLVDLFVIAGERDEAVELLPPLPAI